MQTHPKKRIEVVVEALLMRRIVERLDRANVSGYSVLPIIAGRGVDHEWTADGQVSNAAQMVAVVCIADASKVDEILEAVFAVISRQIGFVTVSDVFVIRPERF